MYKNIISQISYYKKLAPDYHDFALGKGKYKEEKRPHLTEEFLVRKEIDNKCKPHSNILEIACGSGYWTEHLSKLASSLTAIDSSTEMILKNKKNVNSLKITYINDNIFEWIPVKKFDFIFFGFWLSHIPPTYFNRFWDIIKQALNEDGKYFFVDDAYYPTGFYGDNRMGMYYREKKN